MDEELAARLQAEYDMHARLLAGLEGAASLIGQYGHAPSFHDALVDAVSLSMSGKSLIKVSNPYPTIYDSGHLLVTFEIEKIVDASLDLFGENILMGLLLRSPAPRPERVAYQTRPVAEADVEFVFEPTCGLSGFIIGRGVAVRWTKDRRARVANISA